MFYFDAPLNGILPQRRFRFIIVCCCFYLFSVAPAHISFCTVWPRVAQEIPQQMPWQNVSVALTFQKLHCDDILFDEQCPPLLRNMPLVSIARENELSIDFIDWSKTQLNVSNVKSKSRTNQVHIRFRFFCFINFLCAGIHCCAFYFPLLLEWQKSIRAHRAQQGLSISCTK